MKGDGGDFQGAGWLHPSSGFMSIVRPWDHRLSRPKDSVSSCAVSGSVSWVFQHFRVQPSGTTWGLARSALACSRCTASVQKREWPKPWNLSWFGSQGHTGFCCYLGAEAIYHSDDFITVTAPGMSAVSQPFSQPLWATAALLTSALGLLWGSETERGLAGSQWFYSFRVTLVAAWGLRADM